MIASPSKRSEVVSMNPFLVRGQVLETKSSGRKMEVLGVENYGEGDLLKLRPAKGDPERKMNLTCCWPFSWVWLPGEHPEFEFMNAIK